MTKKLQKYFWTFKMHCRCWLTQDFKKYDQCEASNGVRQLEILSNEQQQLTMKCFCLFGHKNFKRKLRFTSWTFLPTFFVFVWYVTLIFKMAWGVVYLYVKWMKWETWHWILYLKKIKYLIVSMTFALKLFDLMHAYYLNTVGPPIKKLFRRSQ